MGSKNYTDNPELCGAKRRFFVVSVHHLLRRIISLGLG